MRLTLVTQLACVFVMGCSVSQVGGPAPDPCMATGGDLPRCSQTGPTADAPVTAALRQRVQNIVVIYAENRSFDNLYGYFPHANGLDTVIGSDGQPTAAYNPQVDRSGKHILAVLPPTWMGVTAAGQLPVVSQAQSAGLPNAPFPIETAFMTINGNPGLKLSPAIVNRDLYHRFFEHQMQIDGGRNDMFAAWSDAGGLTMGHFASVPKTSALYVLALNNVLADNFFQGAFGGSFLNHQYLICACAPQYPDADHSPARPSISILEPSAKGGSTPMLTPANGSPASPLDGPPKFARSGNLAPKDYFGAGDGFRAVNTMQPPYQPSGNPPADSDDLLFADARAATTLPPQTQETIGDALTSQGVAWKWYGASWDAATVDGRRDASIPRTVIYRTNPDAAADSSNLDFQAHHQPFNYYAEFDPMAHSEARSAHLRDLRDFVDDAARGTLPAVSFFKPNGLNNQHSGNTSLSVGDQEIADLVRQLQASPQYPGMVIIITYDEFGGFWDHVAPPKGDLLGPGTRIPAIIVSPFAKAGTVDHTQYDTGSILRLITRRFDLVELPGLSARDAGLRAAGAQPMGDLTNALSLQ